MISALPNPFLNSVDVSPPSLTDTAVAPSPGKDNATAEQFMPDVQATRRLDNLGSVQDDRKMSTDGQPVVANSGREAITGLSHNPVTQAVEVRPIAHLIHHTGRLALPRFAPDFRGMWDAVHDPLAPRTAVDPVWADPSPTFLKMVR